MKSIGCAAIFKALADENRVDIVRFIARHPGVTASALLDRLDIAQSTLSHHMKVLVSAGLVNVKRKGKWTHYSIYVETVDRLERFLNGLRSPRSVKSRRPARGGVPDLEVPDVEQPEATVIHMGAAVAADEIADFRHEQPRAAELLSEEWRGGSDRRPVR